MSQYTTTCWLNLRYSEQSVCGIAGVWRFDQSEIDAAIFEALSRSLYHRGPDDGGFLGWAREAGLQLSRHPLAVRSCWLGLVHRRLSILDPSPSGWQPMGTPDRRYYIVFNGEIYNYLELRAELQTLGYTFGSQSDTEVLLTSYAHWGKQALARLVGMFAFVILDIQARTLFLARDCFGIKPLYYAYWHHGFALASEIKALLELPGVGRQVNPQRLYDYLRFGLTDHGGDTLFADIYQLPAAHYLEMSLDQPHRPQPVRYWQMDLHQHCDMAFDEAADKIQELFLKNIRLHLRSDVLVGAALSGGIDSSAIVAAIRHIQGDALELHTFSYIAEPEALNEEAWVDRVGREAATTVHKVHVTPQEIAADVEHLVSLQDEPFGSTSIYAQMRVFRLAHKAGIKVILDGQGADELLGGYRPHLAARLAALLRQRQWLAASRFLARAARLPGATALMMVWRAVGLLTLARYERALKRWLEPYLFPPWLNAAWFARQRIRAQPLWHLRDAEVLREHLYQALVDNSLPMLLRYEDRNSMAFSIESRTPFLTPELVSFVFSLPDEYIIAADGTSKAVFRQAMRGVVPDAILERQDKIGFATPELDWLGALRPWAEKILYSELARQIPALQHEMVKRQWQAVLTGRSAFDFRVWRWINLICWAQRFHVGFEA